MSKNLLIVESPAKAKTIEKFLGKDFTVKSSYGHIRDLAEDSKSRKAIDTENNYATYYEVPPEKRKVVQELREWVRKVDEVWLATDEDREGEAISWHLAEELRLDVRSTKRIVFREITKQALQQAVQNPRTIDLHLVNAQQARRVLDRLIGYELSPLLWKKIRKDLSAGRVQSVAVRLVAEREREIQQFQSRSFYKVAALFPVRNAKDKLVDVKAQLNREYEDQGAARQFLERCIGALYKVEKIDVGPSFRRPAAPFTTSTLQQEASRKLGFSVSRTMSVAQQLYEAGHITYMRTDSTNLSETALQSIAQEVETLYGKNYLKTRHYKSKSANAQEAHEAIRPTYMDKHQAGEGRDEQRLYELIWKRTIASQMEDARLEKTTVDISISTVSDALLIAQGEVLKFDGFLKVYMESNDDEAEEDEENPILPPLTIGQMLDLKEMTATERFTRPAPRYTEAGLVKKLEELGIGRPSTYAPTIAKIMDPKRGYITRESREGTERSYTVLRLDAAQIGKNTAQAISQIARKEMVGADKNKLFASDIGMIVTEFLSEHFTQVMDYRFTAKIEDELDEVAEGKANWVKVVDAFYRPFHQLVQNVGEEADRVKKERLLGKDPKTGHSVLVRMGKFGPVAQIGSPEEIGDAKPRYANLPKGTFLETIALEEALLLFQFPKTLGEYQGSEVSVGEGRFGPYVKYQEAFISIPKNEDPHAVDLERAIALIRQREQADAPIGHYQNKPITKGKGKFGPFVKWNGIYVSIPARSGIALETISQEQAVGLIEEKLQKEENRYIQRWDEWNLSLENGRWGPFIRMGKENYKLLDAEGKKMTAEQAEALTLDEVKAMVLAQGGKFKEEKKTKPKSKKS